jgi:hypothetical protein
MANEKFRNYVQGSKIKPGPNQKSNTIKLAMNLY